MKTQSALLVFALIVWSAIQSSPHWYTGAFVAAGICATYALIAFSPLSLQHKHMVAVIVACAIATGSKPWLGVLLGVTFCLLCAGLSWLNDRAYRRHE